MKLIITFRWYNHLCPAINRNAWTEEEEWVLTYYHQLFGNKWAEIARFLPGRYTITESRWDESMILCLFVYDEFIN